MSEPKYKYICRIPGPDRKPCGKLVCEAPAMILPQINAEPDKHAKQVVEAISNHLMRKHSIGFWGDWQQFLGYMCLGTIESEDAAVTQFLAQFAARLCQVSCIRITDDQIIGQVAALGFTMDDPQRSKVIEAMKQLRDVVSRRIVPRELLSTP